MPMVSCGSGCTVQPDRAAKVPRAVYLIAFLGMGALAYWKGMPLGPPLGATFGRSHGRGPRRPARGRNDRAGGVNGIARPSPRTSAGLLLPRPGARAPADSCRGRPAAARAAADRVRRTRCGSVAGLHHPLRYACGAGRKRGERPGRVVCRRVPGRMEGVAGSRPPRARTATERAAAQLHQAQQQLDVLLNRQIEAVRAASQRRQSPPAPVPSPVENPEWTDLNRQLSDLLGRRSELLSSRTLQHPLVQDVEARIDAARQRLALVPRQLAGAARRRPPTRRRPPWRSRRPPWPIRWNSRGFSGPSRGQGGFTRMRSTGNALPGKPGSASRRSSWNWPPSPRRPALAARGVGTVGGLGHWFDAGGGPGDDLCRLRHRAAVANGCGVAGCRPAPVVGTVPVEAGPCEPVPRGGRLRLLRWALMLLGSLGLSGSLVMLWYVHPAC